MSEHITQVRFAGDDRTYSPDRDLAWLFPQIMEVTRQSLDGHLEPWVRAFLAGHGVGDRELADAYLALANGVKQGLSRTNTHPGDALSDSGFFAAPSAAKLAVFARLGMAVTSIAHHHMRRAAITRDALPMHQLLNHMIEEAERFAARAGRDGST